MINQQDDTVLLAAMKGGDTTAFTALYNRYWRKLFVVASNKLHDPYVAEELTQDVFADLWSRRATLEIKGRLSSYLAVALKYRIIDVMAREQHRRRYESQQTGYAPGVDDSTRQWLAYDDLRQRLEKLVSDLPDKCRIVYGLRQDGLSQKEIAEKLAISVNTVENHLAKAYKSIRDRLEYFKLSPIKFFSIFFVGT